MQSDALQHIDQVGVRVDALQAAGHHEALEKSHTSLSHPGYLHR